MQQITERDALNVSAGRWASIVKESYRKSDIEHGVYVPALQAAAAGGSVGITTGIIAALLGAPVEVYLGLGGVALCGTFTLMLFDGISWARTALESTEYWESEAKQQGKAESATVRVELVDRDGNGGYGRIVYDEIGTDSKTLAMIAQPSTQLSKRGLMDLGVDDTNAMRIVSQLLILGYAVRKKSNEPATWTSKGMALCRAFTGGGGGGGEAKTSDNQQIIDVGEGS